MSYYIRRKAVQNVLALCKSPKSLAEIMNILIPMGVSRLMCNRIVEEMTAARLLENKGGTPIKWQTRS